MRVICLLCMFVVMLANPAAAEERAPPKDVVAPVRLIDPSVCSDPAAADCSALIADDKAERRKRIEALLIRAKALVVADRSAAALADYDTALAFDPTMTDVLNARGELRRVTGDRPRALADFAAVLKIRPDHEQARENRKSLSKEIERIGAEMAIGKASSPAAPLK